MLQGRVMKRHSGIMLALTAILPMSAAGAGLAAHEQSTSALGSAMAGSAAFTEDASGQWYNPALTGIPAGSVVSLNSQLSFLESRFTDETGGGGDNRESVGRTLNSFYFSDAVGDRLGLGLALNHPFAVERRYDDPWGGSSYALETRLGSLNVNPSLSWQISDRLRLGVGVSYQKIDMELRNSVYTLDVDDTGMGWNAGLLFEPVPGHRLGLAWRSQVNYEFEGELRPASGGQRFPVRSVFDTPGTVSGSYAGDLTGQTRLLLSVSMTEWQQVQQLVIERTDASGSLVEDLGWDNAVMASAGVHHRTANGVMLRAGYAHETSSQDKEEERAPLAPDADRHWLSVGAGFRPVTDLSVDVAVARVLFDDAEIDRSEDRDGMPGDETVRGTFRMNRTIVGVQLNYRF